MALSNQGQIEWLDAIADTEKQLLGQWIGSRYVVLLNQIEPLTGGQVNVRQLMRHGPNMPLPHDVGRIAGANRWIYRLYLLDRVDGMIVYQHDLQPLDAALIGRASVLLDDHMVLSTDSSTIIISARGHSDAG